MFLGIISRGCLFLVDTSLKNSVVRQLSINMQVNDTSNKEKRKRKRDFANKQYLTRMGVFSGVLALLFLFYVISFMNGGTFWINANNITDGWLNALLSPMGNISPRLETFTKLFTFGPTSYIITCSFIAIIASFIASRTYANKIKYRLNDGTSNLLPEKSLLEYSKQNETWSEWQKRKREEMRHVLQGSDDFSALPEVDVDLGDTDDLGWDLDTNSVAKRQQNANLPDDDLGNASIPEL